MVRVADWHTRLGFASVNHFHFHGLYLEYCGFSQRRAQGVPSKSAPPLSGLLSLGCLVESPYGCNKLGHYLRPD